jgi:hypothetical protein
MPHKLIGFVLIVFATALADEQRQLVAAAVLGKRQRQVPAHAS